MGRKVRNYLSKETVKNYLMNFVEENQEAIEKDLIEKVNVGYNLQLQSLDELIEFEYSGAGYNFGFDCGLVYIRPSIKEWKHEWELDNGKYDAELFIRNLPFNSQSTTLQKIQIDYILENCKINNLTTRTWLD